MSDQDMSDSDPHKNFTIVPVENDQVMAFHPHEPLLESADSPRFELQVHAPDGGIETHPLTGNAYVLNEGGKTIASHGC
jgi:hypothetical protein